MKASRSFGVLAAVALIVGWGLAAAPAALARTARVTIADSVAAPASRTDPVGPVARSTQVSFDVVLSLRNAGAAANLVRSISTPGTTSYRHYLTASAWESRFSPTGGAVTTTSTWLRGQGFHVGAVAKDRLTIAATGTAVQVEKAFATTLGEYRYEGRTLRLASRDLSIPSRLAGLVTGVMGVSEHPMISADQTAAAKPATDYGVAPPAAFVVSPDCDSYFGQTFVTEQPTFGHGYPTPVPNAVCGYTPEQLRSAYSIPSTETGAGMTIAIVDAYASSTQPDDAARFFGDHDPDHPFTDADFSQVVGQPFDDEDACDASSWQGEEALDLVAAHSLAPDAHIVYVGGADCEDGLFAALQTAVDDHLADVVSNSYGDAAGDLLDPASEKTAYDDEFMLAATTGISVLFSTGDDGDNFDLAGISAPDYPASSPYVTAVGGTTLAVDADGERTAEWGWSTGRSFLCTANVENLAPGCDASTVGTWSSPLTEDGISGGSTSYTYPQPYYQAGIVPDTLAQRNVAFTGTQDMRVIPDISMDADPATGMRYGLTETFPDGSVAYGESRVAGTSLATPLLAGVVADVGQVAGQAIGFVNPAIYHVERTTPAAIEDILAHHVLAQVRTDYASQALGAGTGNVETIRAITWEGQTEYCDGTGNCATRPNTLRTAKGYDSLTGLGSIDPGFIAALAQ